MSKGYKVVRDRAKGGAVNKPADTRTDPKLAPRVLTVTGIPKSKEVVLQPKLETVDGAKQHGNVIDAQPTVCGGCDSGTGHWEGDGASIKFIKNAGSDGHDESVAGLSDRSFNTTGAPAPNKKKK